MQHNATHTTLNTILKKGLSEGVGRDCIPQADLQSAFYCRRLIRGSTLRAQD